MLFAGDDQYAEEHEQAPGDEPDRLFANERGKEASHSYTGRRCDEHRSARTEKNNPG